MKKVKIFLTGNSSSFAESGFAESDTHFSATNPRCICLCEPSTPAFQCSSLRRLRSFLKSSESASRFECLERERFLNRFKREVEDTHVACHQGPANWLPPVGLCVACCTSSCRWWCCRRQECRWRGRTVSASAVCGTFLLELLLRPELCLGSAVARPNCRNSSRPSVFGEHLPRCSL